MTDDDLEDVIAALDDVTRPLKDLPSGALPDEVDAALEQADDVRDRLAGLLGEMRATPPIADIDRITEEARGALFAVYAAFDQLRAALAPIAAGEE